MADPAHDAALAVLLIEDNPGDARLIALLLDEAPGAPISLSRADRLAAGLRHLGEHGADTDAVLLDLSLPDSQGLATFTRVQERAPGVPIVVLSGLNDEEMAVRAVQAGAQDYLIKGHVDGQILRRALRYAIERKRAEEDRLLLLARERAARAEAERLAAEYTATLGQIADAVLVADRDGQLTFSNAAAQRLFGTVAIEAEACWQDPEGRALDLSEQPLHRAAVRGEATIDGEWRIARPDGVVVIVQGSATPLLTDGGTRRGAVVTLHDVTTRHNLEREKEEFFANASHDLRTPLATIKASIGVVVANEPPNLPPALHRLLTNIDHAATEMTRLVNDLLELSRLQQERAFTSVEPYDLGHFARRVARAIEPLVQERGQELTLDLPEVPVLVLADGPRLERALMNLLSNAQKYGHEGGHIRLSVAVSGAEALIGVADDGPGIPLEDQPRIFERFYRPATEAARRVVGSGLGLPIVRAIIERHGGRVWVESAPGVGSTFRIALPLARATARAGREGVLR